MNVYKISAGSVFGVYREIVTCFTDMEEKSKCYEKKGKRIDKSKIGKIDDGVSKGTFAVYVLSKEEIPLMRSRIHEMCLRATREAFENAKANFDAVEKHDTTKEITITEQ